MNSPIFFLVNICLIGIVQSMSGSFIYSTMNMLEKRYAYDSKISAYINIADNISNMMVSLACAGPANHAIHVLMWLHFILTIAKSDHRLLRCKIQSSSTDRNR